MTSVLRPTLYVVGTPIGNLSDLSPRAAATLGGVDVIACEDTRRTAKLLRYAGITCPRLVVVNDHSERDAVAGLLGSLASGESVALVSDAGMPAISDPGHLLISAAVEAGFGVEVVPGPSAAIAALVLSGLVSDRFCFEGFVPRKGAERTRRLAAVAIEGRTTVLYEAPHRLARTLAELRALIGDERAVVVARELTKLHEEVWRTTLGEAAAVAAAIDPRGEQVVVLAGAPAVAVDDATVAADLAGLLDAGASARDAVESVSVVRGLGRNRVYQVMLSLDR